MNVSQPLETIGETERTPLYGWVIVVVAALAMVATLPGRTHGLSLITVRVLADTHFEWNPDPEKAKVQYADINLWATLAGGLFCLPCGWLIDRFGFLRLLTATLLLLAGAVFWMTHARDLTEFSIAILLTRGFGQSALSVLSIAMVGKWFRGRLGMPMAVYTLLMSLGFVFAFGMAENFKNADWRELWDGIAFCLIGFTLVAVLLMREPPTAAAPQLPSPGAEGAPADDAGFTVAQSMRTPAFWVFGISISVVALGSGQALWNESLLEELGFSKDVFYDLLKIGPLVGMCCQLPVGWLSRHVPLNRLLSAAMVLMAICQAILPSIRSHTAIYTYAVVMGVSGTISTVLFFTIWGQAFGRKHLGKIQGIAQMLTVLASALGPRIFAGFHAIHGSYDWALHLMAGIAALIAVWSLTIRVPRPEDAPRSASQPTPVTSLQEQ